MEQIMSQRPFASDRDAVGPSAHGVTLFAELEVGAKTDRGGRATNEDDFGQYCLRRANEPEKNATAGHLFIVADGMGGLSEGKQASDMAVDIVLDRYYREFATDGDVERSLREAFRAANEHIRALATSSKRPMGATAVAAVISGPKLFVAHAGDSRAYRIREGRAQRLTQDHSWAEEITIPQGLPTDAISHSPYRHRVTRALGLEPQLIVDVNAQRDLAYDVQVGDYILLCSDGLTTKVSDADIEKAFANLPSPEVACGELIDLAKERETSDNITVIVAQVKALEPLRTMSPAGYAPIEKPATVSAVTHPSEMPEALATKEGNHRGMSFRWGLSIGLLMAALLLGLAGGYLVGGHGGGPVVRPLEREELTLKLAELYGWANKGIMAKELLTLVAAPTPLVDHLESLMDKYPDHNDDLVRLRELMVPTAIAPTALMTETLEATVAPSLMPPATPTLIPTPHRAPTPTPPLGASLQRVQAPEHLGKLQVVVRRQTGEPVPDVMVILERVGDPAKPTKGTSGDNGQVVWQDDEGNTWTRYRLKGTEGQKYQVSIPDFGQQAPFLHDPTVGTIVTFVTPSAEDR